MNNIEYSSVSFIVHGNARRMEITCFHMQDNCCFKLNLENTSEFVSSGSVTAKGDLEQIYKMKDNTTVFPKNWDAERVLNEIAKGAREGRVIDNGFISNQKIKQIGVYINENLTIIINTNVQTKDVSIFPVSKFKKK